MGRLLSCLGGAAGGYAGWALGAPAGPFAAYVVSTIGTGAGVYAARRFLRHVGL